MSITTRTGDDGRTFCAMLGKRVSKSHPAIEFQGSLDEAISFIGLARSLLPPEAREEDGDLKLIQNILFALGASLSRKEPAPARAVEILEKLVSKYYREPLRHFILPSGHAAVAAIHVARALVRRAERRLVALLELGLVGVDRSHLMVINRASDALFAIAMGVSRRYFREPEKAEVSWSFIEGGEDSG